MAKITVEYLDKILDETASKERLVELLNEKVSQYILVSERLPNCYETGAWDGLRSDFVLCVTKLGNEHIARVYLFDEHDDSPIWYDNNDYDIEAEIIGWMPLPNKPV